MNKKRLSPQFSEMSRGQSIVLIAGAFMGLVAFIGLAVDTGLLFIGYGHLRRAADAAALGAAAQFRQSYSQADLDNSASEYLRMNGVNLDNASATVFTCDGGGDSSRADAGLCGSTPKRKLVRVQASADVQFVFMPILRINKARITADATGEAASLDVVLVIDISETMTYDAAEGDPNRDPSVCNASKSCHPFEEVKTAAKSLVANILNKEESKEEDRVAIVIFSNGWENLANRGTYVVMPPGSTDGWTSSKSDAITEIDNLQVYDPGIACNVKDSEQWSHDKENAAGDALKPGPCRYYSDNIVGVYKPENYHYFNCPLLASTKNDLSTCSTTNIGGGLKLGALQFGSHSRSESVWVEILLTDGVPNAACEDDANGIPHCMRSIDVNNPADLPIPYCPHVLREGSSDQFLNNGSPSCRDDDVTTFHNITNTAFDTEDYARLAALYAGCLPRNPSPGCGGIKGQGAVIFAVGLGNEVIGRKTDFITTNPATVDKNGKPFGDTLLRYIANVGDDGNPDPSTDQCASVSIPSNGSSYSCGNYYFSRNGSGLTTIFNDIASRIFTRISK